MTTPSRFTTPRCRCVIPVRTTTRVTKSAFNGGDDFEHKIRLVANDGVEIHPYIANPNPIEPVEFAIPPGVIKKGELLLTWSGQPGLGGNGRSCEVSEVWLIRD